MNLFLALVGVIALLYAFVGMLFGKSVVHEISSLVSVMLAVISFIGIAIVNRLDEIKKLLSGKEASKPRSSTEQEVPKAVIIG